MDHRPQEHSGKCRNRQTNLHGIHQHSLSRALVVARCMVGIFQSPGTPSSSFNLLLLYLWTAELLHERETQKHTMVLEMVVTDLRLHGLHARRAEFNHVFELNDVFERSGVLMKSKRACDDFDHSIRIEKGTYSCSHVPVSTFVIASRWSSL
jgi:hypothetical protein